jgi:hypothetical protein
MTNWFFIASPIVLIALAAIRVVERSRHRRALAQRASMSVDEIYRTWYQRRQIDKTVFEELWTEVAQSLGESPNLLRPHDRFGKDVGRAGITTDELDELHERAIRRLDNLGVQRDLSKVETVDEYIVALSNAQSVE